MISIIIPVGSRSHFVDLCLRSIKASTYQPVEVVLVFDGWPGILFKPQHYPFTIKNISIKKAGPAKCRNVGANLAKGSLLLFLDADVVLHKESIGMALTALQAKNADAIIGSYDDEPGQKDAISQFRNLLHHYHHQQNSGQKGVFWGAFGLIKKSVFVDLGGFNEDYKQPSVEDIELGYRLQDKGYTAILESTILLKHLKKWTLANMIYTDIFKRAVPWTILLTKHQNWTKNKLNTTKRERISAALVLFSMLFLFLGFWHVYLLFGALFFLFVLLLLQRHFYRFLSKKCSATCLFSAIILHHLYYLSAIVGFFIAQIKINLTQQT